MKKVLLAGALALGTLGLAGCADDAQVVNHNLTKAADNFEIVRRVVFYNGITNDYMLEIQGVCSINDRGSSVQITCMESRGNYVRHQLGLSDNVTYFSEQVGPARASANHYRVTFKPSTIVPAIDLR